MATFEPTKLPTIDLVDTNCVFFNSRDARALGIKDTPTPIRIKNYIFTARAHNDVLTGHLALSRPQRTFARIGLHDSLEVTVHQLPSDTPQISEIHLRCDRINAGSEKDMMVNTEDILHDVIKCLRPHYLQQGQDFVSTLTSLGVQVQLYVKCLKAQTGFVSGGVLASSPKVQFFEGDTKTLNFIGDFVGEEAKNPVLQVEFDYEKWEIGGLSKEFGMLFTNVFRPRQLSRKDRLSLNIESIKGVVLHGPPGTGKTLIARKLAKYLNSAPPKIVNGPELLNKYVGQSEENVRELFKDAEAELKEKGDASRLHVIIFDEFDAIGKRRSEGDSTGVANNVVNQLLTKIDGVDSLCNVLIIGMTNRLDLLDPALLRPGRFQLQIEISLPDHVGRLEILRIHTAPLRTSKKMDENVNLDELARATLNFSGAELKAVIQSATYLALGDESDLGTEVNVKNVRVTQQHVNLAVSRITPAYGFSVAGMESYYPRGLALYSTELKNVVKTGLNRLLSFQESQFKRVEAMLLCGPRGCGKTAIAAYLACESKYPFVRMITPRDVRGSELAGFKNIEKIFAEAHKSDLSILILDEVEDILGFVDIGPRFSQLLLQGLKSLISTPPENSHRKSFVIATTRDKDFLINAGFTRKISTIVDLPNLQTEKHVTSCCEALKLRDANQLMDIKEYGRKGISCGDLIELVETSENAV